MNNSNNRGRGWPRDTLSNKSVARPTSSLLLQLMGWGRGGFLYSYFVLVPGCRCVCNISSSRNQNIIS